jgi:Tfp pilus assembly protein PilZ
MKHYRTRTSGEGHRIQVLSVNDKEHEEAANSSFFMEDICKGGFRFISNHDFELEDRLHVLLSFPDENSQKVLGRICYIDDIGKGNKAYGFSVLDGFYSLRESVA